MLALLVFTKAANFGSVQHVVLEQFGFILVFVAVLGRIWCTLYIAGRKNKQLCTVGPYEICRNPLYLFSFVGLFGIVVAAGSILLAILSAAAYLVYYHGVIRGEEQRLAAIFGADFARYVAATPRFWPKWKISGNATVLHVDSRIFTRSLLEVIWFLFLVVFIEIVEVVKSKDLLSTIVLPF
ncbi:MAG: isoprenylcysteine carboxylmethyltransferase family protein [Verrucomicrobia bacterium]|nr:isoprenylcysteine carboxylmethyltransferase family protein [Verrucomicrobiota bacterium]